MPLTGAAAASGIAWVNSLGILAGGVTSPVIGYLRDSTGSYESGLYFLAGLSVAGALITVLWVHEPEAQLAPGAATTVITQAPGDVRIQIANGKLPWNYQQLAGFQMTQAQIAYAKNRGRYLP